MLFCVHSVRVPVLKMKRGRVLLPAFWARLSEGCEEVEGLTLSEDDIKGKVNKAEGYFKEVGR